MALAGRRREVLELEVSAGRVAGNGAIGNANMDAENRGVAVVNWGFLAEVAAKSTSVGYSGVGDGKAGWGGEGWAAG